MSHFQHKYTYYFHFPFPVDFLAMTGYLLGLGGVLSLQEYKNTLGKLKA